MRFTFGKWTSWHVRSCIMFWFWSHFIRGYPKISFFMSKQFIFSVQLSKHFHFFCRSISFIEQICLSISLIHHPKKSVDMTKAALQFHNIQSITKVPQCSIHHKSSTMFNPSQKFNLTRATIGQHVNICATQEH